MSRRSPLKRKRTSQSRKKYSGYSGGNRRPGEKPKNFKETVSRFVPLLKPFIPGMVVVLIAGVIGTVLTVTGPMFLGDIVDAIKEQADIKLSGGEINFSKIQKILLTILGIYGLSAVLSYVQHYIMAGVTQSVVRDLRDKVNDKLTHLPLSYIDSHSKGDILSKMMNDIDNISNTLQNNLIQIITSAVSFIGMLALMFYVSWQLTLITLSVLPPSLLVISLISKRSKRYFRRQWDETGNINGHIEEMYTGHTLIKVFDHEEQAIDEFDDINVSLAKAGYKAQFISGIIGPILNFVSNIAYVLICVIGGVYVIKGTFSLGDITTFFTYSKLFMQPLVSIGNIANNLQSSLASAERVFNLLDEPDDEFPLAELLSGALLFRCQIVLDPQIQLLGNLERKGFGCCHNGFSSFKMFFENLGDVLAEGLSQCFPLLPDTIMQSHWNLGAEVSGCFHGSYSFPDSQAKHTARDG